MPERTREQDIDRAVELIVKKFIPGARALSFMFMSLEGCNQAIIDTWGDINMSFVKISLSAMARAGEIKHGGIDDEVFERLKAMPAPAW